MTLQRRQRLSLAPPGPEPVIPLVWPVLNMSVLRPEDRDQAVLGSTLPRRLGHAADEKP